MINAITLLWRKPGMSIDAFQRYWRNEHAGVITRLPGFQRYVQSHPLDENYQVKEPICDGIAELWANDSQVFRDIAVSEAYSLVQVDEEKFLDRAANTLVLTVEHVIREGPVAVDGVKCIQFFNRRKQMHVDLFQTHWRDVHGPLMATLPLLTRYAQYHVRPGAYKHGRQPVCDGFDVTWFDSKNNFYQAMGSAINDRVRLQQEKFLSADDCPQILTREHVITSGG